MDQYVIRHLSGDNLGGALRLSSTAGWNQRLEDWRLLVSLAPGACFAAVSGARVVGTAIGLDYGRFSWIAMMLVDPAWRGRGIGRRLLEAAMDAVPSDRPIRLDATPMGRPLYLSCGFEDECLLTRHVADADAGTAPLAGRANVRPMTTERLRAVVDADVEVFGGTRRAVLAWALDTAPAYCHLIDADAGGGPQYCFGRRGRLFDQIGPVVADRESAACALAAAALAAGAGRPLVVDSYDGQAGFPSWLRRCGFTPQRPLFRMRRGPVSGARGEHGRDGRDLAEFAIFGPEFA